MPKLKHQWLADLIEADPELTQAGLAKALGIAAPRVSEIIKGIRRVQLRELPLMAEYLDKSEEFLTTRFFDPEFDHKDEPRPLRHLGEAAAEYFQDVRRYAGEADWHAHRSLGNIIEHRNESYAAVPVYDARASAGPGALAVNDAEPLHDHLFRLQWLRTITAAPIDHLAVVQVDGDSMEPTLHNGDHVLVDRSRNRVGRDAIYVFRIAGEEEVFVKRCSRDARTKLLSITSDNAFYPAKNDIRDDDISVLGRVIWLGRSIGG